MRPTIVFYLFTALVVPFANISSAQALTWTITDMGVVEDDFTYVSMVVNNTGAAAYAQWTEGRDPKVVFHQNNTLYGVTIPGLDSIVKLNDNGCFTGYLLDQNGNMQGFLFCNNQLETFGQGFEFTEVTDLNNNNVVLGSYTRNPDAGYVPFTYQNGIMTDLGGFTSPYIAPMAMNDKGMIVGSAAVPPYDMDNAFIYHKGQVSMLGTMGGEYSSAYDINNSGVVIGTADDASGMSQAFICEDGQTLTQLVPGAYYSYANDLNDQGTVIGEWALGETDWNGFIYLNGRFIDVSPPEGHSLSLWALNNNNVALGYLTNNVEGMDTVVLYSPETGMTPLIDVIVNGQGWDILSAEGIGDDNTIVGMAEYQGRMHIYLLTPNSY